RRRGDLVLVQREGVDGRVLPYRLARRCVEAFAPLPALGPEGRGGPRPVLVTGVDVDACAVGVAGLDVVARAGRGGGREDAAVALEDNAEGERLARALEDDDAAGSALFRRQLLLCLAGLVARFRGRQSGGGGRRFLRGGSAGRSHGDGVLLRVVV